MLFPFKNNVFHRWVVEDGVNPARCGVILPLDVTELPYSTMDEAAQAGVHFCPLCWDPKYVPE